MQGLDIRKSNDTGEYTIKLPDGRMVPMLEAHLGRRALDVTPRYMGVPLQNHREVAPMPNSSYGYIRVQEGNRKVWWTVDWNQLGHPLDEWDSPRLPLDLEPIIGAG